MEDKELFRDPILTVTSFAIPKVTSTGASDTDPDIGAGDNWETDGF